jgi:hypothetical protein
LQPGWDGLNSPFPLYIEERERVYGEFGVLLPPNDRPFRLRATGPIVEKYVQNSGVTGRQAFPTFSF